jgi:glycosyltransferase involved in cell wall biosynthesis
MNLGDIQVIMVNDTSNDKSKDIINEYSATYQNFIAIHLDENIGGAYGPRNIGLKKATGEYIMFLDSDDTYVDDACQLLYDEIKSSNVDIVFGRYLRINPEHDLIQKSYTPYKDNIFSEYSNDILNPEQMSSIVRFFWKNMIVKLIYGKEKNTANQSIQVNCLLNDYTILKILPSIWTRIFRRDIIEKNNIEFPSFISGEDLNFIIEYYFNSNKILFLNDKVICNHIVRDLIKDKSITKKMSFKLVHDSIKSYSACLDICNKYNFKHSYTFLNAFLLNWISIFLKYDGNINENKILIDEIKNMKKAYHPNLIGTLIINFTIILIKISKILKRVKKY